MLHRYPRVKKVAIKNCTSKLYCTINGNDIISTIVINTSSMEVMKLKLYYHCLSKIIYFKFMLMSNE